MDINKRYNMKIKQVCVSTMSHPEEECEDICEEIRRFSIAANHIMQL